MTDIERIVSMINALCSWCACQDAELNALEDEVKRLNERIARQRLIIEKLWERHPEDAPKDGHYD